MCALSAPPLVSWTVLAVSSSAVAEDPAPTGGGPDAPDDHAQPVTTAPEVDDAADDWGMGGGWGSDDEEDDTCAGPCTRGPLVLALATR